MGNVAWGPAVVKGDPATVGGPAPRFANATHAAVVGPPGGKARRKPVDAASSAGSDQVPKASLIAPNFAAQLANFPDPRQKIPCSLRREFRWLTADPMGIFDRSNGPNSLQIAKIPCKFPYNREFGC